LYRMTFRTPEASPVAGAPLPAHPQLGHLAALRDDPCRMLDTGFREFLFPDVG
jgi:hypothetical protein